MSEVLQKWLQGVDQRDLAQLQSSSTGSSTLQLCSLSSRTCSDDRTSCSGHIKYAFHEQNFCSALCAPSTVFYRFTGPSYATVYEANGSDELKLKKYHCCGLQLALIAVQ